MDLYIRIGVYSLLVRIKNIDLYMALVDYDSCEFWLDVPPKTELNEALTQLALDMCHITEDVDEVPQYTVRENTNFVVPKNHEGA